ncbi:MAG: hypothetical protein IE880_04475 [Epsilonproteobacteria bacterium]|nr:hypothetical protein [Campylobacterota bacterium]
MLIHSAIVMAGYSFDEFIENLVDNNMDTISDTSYFIQNFTQPNDILLSMLAKHVNEAKEVLKKLQGAGK